MCLGAYLTMTDSFDAATALEAAAAALRAGAEQLERAAARLRHRNAATDSAVDAVARLRQAVLDRNPSPAALRRHACALPAAHGPQQQPD